LYDIENDLKKMVTGGWRKVARNSDTWKLILKQARTARTVHPLGRRRKRRDAPPSPYSKCAGGFLLGCKGGRFVKLTTHLSALCSNECSYTTMDRAKFVSEIRRSCETYSLNLQIIRRQKLAMSNGSKQRSIFRNIFGYVFSTQTPNIDGR
jgi:hypothetical protein